MLSRLMHLGAMEGAPGVELTLRRAWAQGRDGLLLEYVDRDGVRTPGRWMRGSVGALGASDDGTVVVDAGGERVRLYPRGADPDLPGLAPFARSEGAEVVSHRPGRRAVVRLAGDAGYAKVVRPSRVERVLAAQGVAHEAAHGFGVAPVVRVERALGAVVFGVAPGVALHDLAGHDDTAYVEGCRRAAEAVRLLHGSEGGVRVGRHTAADEIGLLEEKLSTLEVFAPELAIAARAAARGVMERLRGCGGEVRLIHRDLYDKQVLIGTGGVCLLDFDTLAAGDACLDVGNFVAHIELRVVQGACSAGVGEGATRAFLEGYGDADAERVRVYRDATMLRLGMLYTLWPAWRWIASELIDRVGGVESVWGEGRARVAAGRASRGVSGEAGVGGGDAPAFFVLGSPRSGTTLLERMLDAHPMVAMTHETHWITSSVPKGGAEGRVPARLLDELYADRRFARMAPERAELERALRAREGTYIGLVRAVFGAFGERAGKSVVGDKSTGGYLRDIPGLLAICPWARVVHLVRDGRDVCLSMLGWSKAARAAGRSPLWSEDPVATTAAWWRWHMLSAREGINSLGAGRALEVRYEQLVERPEEECARVCAFLGLPRHDAMTRFHDGRTRSETGLTANAAWLPATPGLRDWRSQMSTEQSALFEAVAWDALEAFGYPRVEASGSLVRYAAEFLARWEAAAGVSSRTGGGRGVVNVEPITKEI